jgi:hypothetical protein
MPSARGLRTRRRNFKSQGYKINQTFDEITKLCEYYEKASFKKYVLLNIWTTVSIQKYTRNNAPCHQRVASIRYQDKTTTFLRKYKVTQLKAVYWTRSGYKRRPGMAVKEVATGTRPDELRLVCISSSISILWDNLINIRSLFWVLEILGTNPSLVSNRNPLCPRIPIVTRILQRNAGCRTLVTLVERKRVRWLHF